MIVYTSGKRTPILNNAQITVEMAEKRMRPLVPLLPKPVEPEEFSDTDSNDGSRNARKPYEKNANAVFISALPFDMPEQRLFDTLWDVFTTVGRIKVITTTNATKYF